MLRGIFFDLDDTLIAYSLAEHTALMAGCKLAAQLDERIRERALAAAIYEGYARHFGYGTPGFAELATLPVRAFRTRLTQNALALLGVHDAVLTEALVEAYAQSERDALQVFPDVRATLARLRPHFRLGVITNGPGTMQRDKLETLGLASFFDAIVVDTEFGHPKPDPRIFAHAAGIMELPPSDLLFVGNSLSADVAGARASGWNSVWLRADGDGLLPTVAGDGLAEAIPTEGNEHAVRPHYVVSCVAQVADLAPVAAVLSEAAHASDMETFRAIAGADGGSAPALFATASLLSSARSAVGYS